MAMLKLRYSYANSMVWDSFKYYYKESYGMVGLFFSSSRVHDLIRFHDGMLSNGDALILIIS